MNNIKILRLFSLNFFKKISLITGMLLFGYVLLLGYFNVVDVYHHYFFSTGFTVVIYNFFRVCFIVFLPLLFYLVGVRILIFAVGDIYYNSLTLEFILLAFFAGIGASHIILFLIGFVGLYTRLFMAVLTLFVLMTSFSRLNQLILYLKVCAEKIYWPGIVLLVIPATLFLMTKGLYPAGGHDYYQHYFHYYRNVTESGSILPNQVWYHFYYCKGAAVFFLSMLLTDPLAPQLATSGMMIGGAAIVFLILRSSSWRLLPWIGVAFYLIFFIYTPGPAVNLAQGGWGDLEKPHELTAVLMLAIIWQAIGLARTKQWRVWGASLVLTVCAMMLINIAMLVFVVGYLVMVFLYLLFYQNKPAALWILYSLITAIICFVLTLTVNYLLTGLPHDQGLLYFWPLINYEKVKEWGVLFELLNLYWAWTGLIANKIPFSLELLGRALTDIRLDLWWPLLLVGIIAAIWQKWQFVFLWKKTDKTSTLSMWALGGFIVMTFVFSLVIGRNQPISFYRFTTFTYAPMLCFSLLFLATMLNRPKAICSAIVFAFVVICLSNYHGRHVKKIFENSFEFIIGKYSIADAYRNQQGWPGRMPWGGIYPPLETVWKLLPPHTRIWSMHVHSYCMLPDCDVQSYMTHRFSLHAEEIFYASPEQAKRWLKKEKLNYFFFSDSLQLTDPLPLAPLFSPTYIKKFLGIAWTDGHNTLLTWKEQSSTVLDQRWLVHYKKSINSASIVNSFPYKTVKALMYSINHKRLPNIVGF